MKGTGKKILVTSDRLQDSTSKLLFDFFFMRKSHFGLFPRTPSYMEYYIGEQTNFHTLKEIKAVSMENYCFDLPGSQDIDLRMKSELPHT